MKKVRQTKRSRGELTVSVLEQIASESPTASDLISALLATPRQSFRQVEWRAKKIAHNRRQEEEQLALIRAEEQKYRQLLYVLKRDGLLIITGEKRSYLYNLTESGRTFLRRLKKEIAERQEKEPVLPYPTTKRKPHLIVISYDVPERYRRYRAWLRKALSSLGFTMTQQSVWSGRVALPVEFIRDLKRMGLIKYVEILTVERTGSLKTYK